MSICGGDVAKAEHGRAGGERPPRHDRKRRHPCDRDDRDRADHPRRGDQKGRLRCSPWQQRGRRGADPARGQGRHRRLGDRQAPHGRHDGLHVPRRQDRRFPHRRERLRPGGGAEVRPRQRRPAHLHLQRRPRPLRRGDRRARQPVCQGKRHRPEAQALGRAHHGVIDPNLIGTTSLYQPFGQVRFLAGLSTFFRGRAAGEMHLQGDFAFTEDDSVNIMDADKIWRRCEKAALR